VIPKNEHTRKFGNKLSGKNCYCCIPRTRTSLVEGSSFKTYYAFEYADWYVILRCCINHNSYSVSNDNKRSPGVPEGNKNHDNFNQHSAREVNRVLLEYKSTALPLGSPFDIKLMPYVHMSIEYLLRQKN
jgi:hypothetical protein